ncbi:MAG: DUF3109 family protein [Bacteroidaceae bacterium]|nr:DUF3109 family protein [Bacteroidaceae bacterium]
MLPLLQIQNVILSPDIITEHFCCDLSICKGQCCIEGENGAPITLDEVATLETAAEEVWPSLSAQAQAVIDRQGVCYSDAEGDLVTSIVGGKDCVFTTYDAHTGCCLCAIESAAAVGQTQCQKPISCQLYPIREKQLSNGLIALNYHRWSVCKSAVEMGKKLKLPIYIFLEKPLIRRFGQEWYDELSQTVKELSQQKIL